MIRTRCPKCNAVVEVARPGIHTCECGGVVEIEGSTSYYLELAERFLQAVEGET